ncbi:MAG: hypothetical protein JXJ20_06390 [Anaerolineae bacterium]|nr:hypothetical protein [Anaerolineae bacterium]
MTTSQQPSPAVSRHVDLVKWLGLSLLSLFVLFITVLVLTGEAWRALGYVLVALFGFLIVLAVYFWGVMIFGGFFQIIRRHGTPVPWDINPAQPQAAPEHDIDPGLELLAAGVLVYHLGEVRPIIHFRQVPTANMRAIRPFVVVRTGGERRYLFDFTLTNAHDKPLLAHQISRDLTHTPQLVTLPFRLVADSPRTLTGQRWTLQVRSGVTVVTSFRFTFVDGVDQAVVGLQPPAADDEPPLPSQQALLERLVDAALKQDVLLNTQEITLEDL